MTALNWQQHPIKLVRSKRKTIGLYVKEQSIELRAPKHVSINELTDFVQSKQAWLTKTLNEQAQLKLEQPDFSQLNYLPFMGVQKPLHIIQSTKTGWRDTPEAIQIFTQNSDKASTHAVLADFYLTKAKSVLHNKTIDLVTQQGWQHKLTDIRFRRTKTKWGHCTAQGRIQYNWLILMAPESVIDYLIAHEVSHLKHLNHSALFWQQVEAIHPTYKKDKQWLSDNGHNLIL
ncbi:M48 family metallopeptidase [Reinekea forsetii]|nr:M48 family metallopeptidase [Reinekea forsetii]